MLARALLDLVLTASKIVERLWKSTPAIGSDAHERLGGRSLGSSAYTEVSAYVSAGTDYLFAFAYLLKRKEELGPSFASLTRSGIETLGRAWWLLEAKDRAQFEHRAAVMHLKDVNDFVSEGGQMERVMPDGTRSLLLDPRSEAERSKKLALGEGKREKVPNYSTLAIALLGAADVLRPKTEYSHLSGVAHGQASVLGSFGHVVDATSGGGEFQIGLPIRNLRNYLWDLTKSLEAVVDRLINEWDLQAERERWTAVKERVWSTLNGIFDLLEAVPDSRDSTN